MKQYSYEVRQVGDWEGIVFHEDGEAVTSVMPIEDAWALRWEWLSQSERDEITLDCELEDELVLEQLANREVSCGWGAA